VTDALPSVPLGDPWLSGWLAGERPALDRVLIRNDQSAWTGGFRSEFAYRDLGLVKASRGLICARQVRRVGHGAIGYEWHCHDADFQFNFALHGSTVVETDDGACYHVKPGDSIAQPGLYRVREFNFSEDFECIQITVPAEQGPTIIGRDAPLPARASRLDPDRRSVYCAAESSDPVLEPPGAPAVSKRDLGSRDLTSGRISLTLIEAHQGGPDGSAYRSAADWIVVLQGSARVSAGDGASPTSLAPLDALAFGSDASAPRLIEIDGPGFRALELEFPPRPPTSRQPADQG
jgi:hypothetical protein